MPSTLAVSQVRVGNVLVGFARSSVASLIDLVVPFALNVTPDFPATSYATAFPQSP